MLHGRCKHKEIGSHWEIDGSERRLNAMDLGHEIRDKLRVVVMRDQGKDNYNFQQRKFKLKLLGDLIKHTKACPHI